MVIYGTFAGFKNTDGEPSKFIWEKLVGETGEETKGNYYSQIEGVFGSRKMKFGERYMINYNIQNNREISNIDSFRLVNKNPKCDIFRKFKHEFHILNGKYKGKKDIDIPDEELASYCIWLATYTNNEATIRNCLNILEKIKQKQNE
jgi:hypothetical protein